MSNGLQAFCFPTGRAPVCLLPAGNGVKGSDYKGGSSGPTQLLNSPWDVALDR